MRQLCVRLPGLESRDLDSSDPHAVCDDAVTVKVPRSDHGDTTENCARKRRAERKAPVWERSHHPGFHRAVTTNRLLALNGGVHVVSTRRSWRTVHNAVAFVGETTIDLSTE